MRREDLDHLLRAAGDLTGHRRFVLVGSATIFAWSDVVPEDMARSREVDLYAFDVSDSEVEFISDLLENIGHLSSFDQTYGYYADGVGPRTAILPSSWRERSKVYRSPSTNGVEGIVPHPEDIALSKLCAGREKDVDWVAAAYAAGLIDLASIVSRVGDLPDRSETERRHILDLLGVVKSSASGGLSSRNTR